MSVVKRMFGNGSRETVNSLLCTLAATVPANFACSVVKLYDVGNTSVAVTLPLASAVGAGAWFVFRNSTTGAKAITRAGTNTINGATNISLASGQCGYFVSDGTNWGSIKTA